MNGASKMAVKTGKKRKRRSYVQEPVKIPADVLLLDATVRVVAKKGVEGTSTRAIAAEAGHGLTDTVIYRFFSGKEDLLLKAFVRESTDFMRQVETLLPVLWETKISREQRLRFLWHTVWTWLSQHKAASTFMIRYYYSASFDENAKNSYQAVWQPIADRLRGLLPDADTESLVYMALETTASSIYPVCAEWRPDGAGASEYGFRRLNGLVNEFLSN